MQSTDRGDSLGGDRGDHTAEALSTNLGDTLGNEPRQQGRASLWRPFRPRPGRARAVAVRHERRVWHGVAEFALPPSGLRLRLKPNEGEAASCLKSY